MSLSLAKPASLFKVRTNFIKQRQRLRLFAIGGTEGNQNERMHAAAASFLLTGSRSIGLTLLAYALLPWPFILMQANRSPEISSELRDRLEQARNVFVMTGAGVSAESGVPTFRGGGNTSVWKGMAFNAISSAEMLRRDLDEVWRWFDYRRDLLEKVHPNAAHRAIAAWEHRFAGFTLATQNVDGLHQEAGSTEVIELHGSIWAARCMTCFKKIDLRAAEEETRRICRSCGGKMRPAVVLFGELLPEGAFEKAALGAGNCDICFVVGTSALVYPAAGLADVARLGSAYMVEINPEKTPLSEMCDEVINDRAGDILPLM